MALDLGVLIRQLQGKCVDLQTALGGIVLQGPFEVSVPAIAAGGAATVLDTQVDITGLTGPHVVLGMARVAAGNQRVALQGYNFPSNTSVNLLFFNTTGAVSVVMPFDYVVLSAK